MSSHLMLKSFLKAYYKNATSAEVPCPVYLLVIEKYTQILLPAYKFNLIMKEKFSTICEVIPALKIMISKWKRFQVTGDYKLLCVKQVSNFRKNLNMSSIQNYIRYRFTYIWKFLIRLSIPFKLIYKRFFHTCTSHMYLLHSCKKNLFLSKYFRNP